MAAATEEGTVAARWAAAAKAAAWPVVAVQEVVAQVEGDEDADPVTPSNIRVLRFLQLMSEGHFEKNQDLMRVQPGTGKPINLLNEFVDLLNSLSKKKSRAATAAAMAVSDVISGS